MKQVTVISTILALVAICALPSISKMIMCSMAHPCPNGDMIIGDQVVLRIHSAAGGMSVQQRLGEVTTRLNKRLGSKEFDPQYITVRKAGCEYAVMHKESLIVTADTEAAAFNKTTCEKLANVWAANLRRVIPLAKAKTDGP